MNRAETLTRATEIVTGDREQQYGKPENNFRNIADRWTIYLRGRGVEVDITPVDVAIMMADLKIARLSTGIQTEDSFIDACGYLACGAEIASGV